jgi:hypothetical protein
MGTRLQIESEFGHTNETGDEITSCALTANFSPKNIAKAAAGIGLVKKQPTLKRRAVTIVPTPQKNLRELVNEL